MPAPISKIKLRNFKAFYGDEEVIELNGKHLLMYGENGSGKSSIYWALYTLFQSATKPQAEIQKYFTPNHNEHLVNYFHVQENRVPDADGNLSAPLSIGLNAYILIELEDGKSLRIDSRGIVPGTDISILEEFNRKSDFISHRLLINFYNFRNSKNINLWEVFVRDVFPFILDQNGSGTKTLSQVLKEIESNKPFKLYPTDQEFSLTKSKNWQTRYNDWINTFNSEVNYWLQELNLKISTLYNEQLRQHDFEKLKITLDYSTPLVFDKYTAHAFQKDGVEYLRYSNLCDLNKPVISLKIETENPDGTFDPIHKPQSHLNEARLTSIALAVRFSLLDETIRTTDEGKTLVLDDLLVSLDMSNRNKVINLILDRYTENYKVQIYTHEKNFFDFVAFKIKQRGKSNDWKIKEIHQADQERSNPVIIDSGLSYYEKAKKYFEAKDYTTCSIYLRKELEKLVVERIPDEFTKTVDGQFYSLSHYWTKFVERYHNLGSPIPVAMDDKFKQSKLLILNPQAHYSSLEIPVYRVEIDEIFKLIDNLKSTIPIPEIKLLVSKDMRLVFIHPTQDYRFECELKSDFTINTLGGVKHIVTPRTKVISWHYQGVLFRDVATGQDKTPPHDIVKDLKDIITILASVPLGITKDLIIENTTIKDGIWTLKELLDKSGITL